VVAAPPPHRGLGEPPARGDAAGEAELDALRGELVRELDRLATGAADSASLGREREQPAARERPPTASS